jgi:hypothetical protein
MVPRRFDRYDTRSRRGNDTEPHVPETESLGLTALGEAFVDVLRDDERFRAIMADPFGEQPGSATAP